MFTKTLPFFVTILLLTACSSDDKANDIIGEELESGAYVKTLSFQNSDLILDDAQSTFSVDLEVHDGQEGGLLQNLEVFATFKDNTPDNGTLASGEILIKTFIPSDFTNGAMNLPIRRLALSYSELATATQIALEDIRCKDQFLIRLNLNLTDGRSFSVANGASSTVIGFDTIFSSPFCYTLSIVSPIPAAQFTGMYRYESIIDGPIGPTFGSPKIVEIRQDPNSVNKRIFETDYIVSRQNEPARPYRFLVACDEIVFQKNQISSFFSWCRPEGGFSFGGPPILLGPDTENSTINPDDDSSFELSFVEGYLGWDGDCEYGTVPVKILFTKQ